MRRVNVYVDQSSCIELHVRETVRIDRLQSTAADGYVAEQHGALLAPGVTQVQLDQGIYHFRTLDDAQLRVLAGGVQVASTSAGDKDTWPDPQKPRTPTARPPRPLGRRWIRKEHGPCGRVPVLTVAYDTEGAP